MKVKELIDVLSSLDQDKEVYYITLLNQYNSEDLDSILYLPINTAYNGSTTDGPAVLLDI